MHGLATSIQKKISTFSYSGQNQLQAMQLADTTARIRLHMKVLRFIGERNSFFKVLQVWKVPSEYVCKKQIA